MRIPRVPGRRLGPIMVALDAAIVAREHWGRLEAKDRRELSRLVKKSQGRPGHLSGAERSELLRIVRTLDLVTAGRKLLPFNGGVRRSRR